MKSKLKGADVAIVRLEKEIAVIGVVNYMLRHPGHDAPLDMDTMRKYARMMEVRTGLAVVLGFSQESLDAFLGRYPDLFVNTDPYGKGKYRMGPYAAPKTPEEITAFVANLITRVDPALNYPMNFIEAMGILGSLEYKGK